MPTKKLAYFKFFHHDWQNSLAVRRMNAAERGVYLSALIVQAIYDFVPTDLKELSRLMDLKASEVRKAWPVVSKQFVQQTTDNVTVLINERLAEILSAIGNESECKSRGAQKANAKRWGTESDTESVSDSDTESDSDQMRGQSETIHAYDSDSVSKSDSGLLDKSLTQSGGAGGRKKTPAPEIAIPEWLPVESWQEWVENRRANKKPMTELAQRKSIKLLEKYRTAGHSPVDVIDLAIANGWTGLHEPTSRNSKPTKSSHDLLAGYTPEQLRGE